MPVERALQEDRLGRPGGVRVEHEAELAVQGGFGAKLELAGGTTCPIINQ